MRWCGNERPDSPGSHGALRNLLKLETRNLKLLFCVLCALCGSGFCLDRNAFTFTEYHLQARIDPPSHSFSAGGTVTLRNDSAMPQKNAVLQISSSLGWQSITLGGKKVLYVSHPYESDIDHTGFLNEAVVTLPQPVAPHANVTLEILYGGTIELDTTRLEQLGTPKDVAANTDWDQISPEFTAVRGVGYVAWYPIAMDSVSLSNGPEYTRALGAWKAREAGSGLSVRFQSAPGEEMYGNNDAVLIGFSASESALEWTHLGYESPFLVTAKYKRDPDNWKGVHYLSGSESDAKAWQAVARAVIPYLLKAPDAMPVIFQIPIAAAVPYASKNTLLTPLAIPDPKAAQVLLANPMSYEYVRSDRPWIAAGFASFSQAFQREKQDGRDAAIDYMAKQREALVEEEKDIQSSATGQQQKPEPFSSAATSLVAGSDEVLYRTKAMYVFWMLREMLGDSVLQRALAKYRAEDDREPSYCQRLLEAEAAAQHVVPKMKLEDFFDDWVYRDRGLPDFKIASTYVRPVLGSPNGQNYLLTVTVQNLGNAGAEVPVTASAGGKERVTHRVYVPARSEASLRVPMVNAADQVTVNDGSVPESDMTNNSSAVAAPTN